MESVPCVRVDNLTDEQVRKLRIVDNKSSTDEYDVEALWAELEDLDFSDFNLDFDFELPTDDEDEDEAEGEQERHNERERTYAARTQRYKNPASFASKISGYARQNAAEAIAEAYSDVYCNGSKANSASRAIVDTLNKYLKGGK